MVVLSTSVHTRLMMVVTVTCRGAESKIRRMMTGMMEWFITVSASNRIAVVTGCPSPKRTYVHCQRDV